MSDRDELLPCPFCGHEAEQVELADKANRGGSCIYCGGCGASSAVEFEFKENLVSRWNNRQPPEPPPTTDAISDAEVEAALTAYCGSEPDDPWDNGLDPDYAAQLKADMRLALQAARAVKGK